MNDENALKIVKLISTAGAARSNYIEAIQHAKKYNFTEAKDLIQEGEDFFLEGHKLHADLISKEAAGNGTEVSLLLVHAEDHMISAETMKILAEEFISLYETLNKINFEGE